MTTANHSLSSSPEVRAVLQVKLDMFVTIQMVSDMSDQGLYTCDTIVPKIVQLYICTALFIPSRTPSGDKQHSDGILCFKTVLPCFAIGLRDNGG